MGIKRINQKYKLNERIYVGPTSADPYLAFLMANQGKVSEHDMVIDLFCGTGGLLVPCGLLDAMCFGSDIDSRVLHGLGVGRIND